jgi:hypothetical protein
MQSTDWTRVSAHGTGRKTESGIELGERAGSKQVPPHTLAAYRNCWFGRRVGGQGVADPHVNKTLSGE